jgi:hypothetical protein
MMDKSPEHIADERVRMDARVLTPAQEPANTNRPADQTPDDPSKNIAEFPIRITPHLNIFLGAVCNTVNEVVEEVETFDVDGSDTPVSLAIPLSRKNNGIAVEGFESVFRFIQHISEQNYVILAANEETARLRIDTQVDAIKAKLAECFGGDVIEQLGASFSIAYSDMFKTDVVLTYKREQSVDAETVNEVHIDVNVYIHVAQLTSMDSLEEFRKLYVARVRNAASATSVDTALYVAFDVSNFFVRPTTLAFFNALLIDETVNVLSVQAVQGEFKHLPREANTLVGISIIKKSKPK